MVNIRDYIEQISGDGKNHIIAELDVDTTADLPSQEFNGYYLVMGSIAHDISTGDFYSMDSSGAWYIQNGGET